MKNSVVKELISTSLYLLFVLVITFLIITYVGQRTDVNGSSMESTLQDKDVLIVDKISYRFREPKRFEIVVFPFQYEDNTYFIKRIIGLPGEEVYIDPEGNIYINGEKLEENFGREVIEDAGRAAVPITLGDDEYFLMGDNRNNSTDSRTELVGNVHRSKLIGRAFVRVFPFDKIEMLPDSMEE